MTDGSQLFNEDLGLNGIFSKIVFNPCDGKLYGLLYEASIYKIASFDPVTFVAEIVFNDALRTQFMYDGPAFFGTFNAYILLF